MPDLIDQLLTAEEAARVLGLKTSTIRRLTYTHELPCVKVTNRRCVRYRWSDLEQLIKLRTRPARA